MLNYIRIYDTNLADYLEVHIDLLRDMEKNIKVKGNITENKEENIALDDIYTKNELFEYLLNNLEAKNKKDINYIVKYLEQDDMYKELLNYTKNDDNLNEETLKLLYNDKLNTSVSKLELFKKCPFSYYMKYILKIEPKATFVSPGKIQNLRFAKNGQQLQVSFTRNNSDGALATVRLMDSQGKTLTFTHKRSTSGENSFALDVPQASGSFFLNLLVGTESKTIPLNF